MICTNISYQNQTQNVLEYISSLHFKWHGKKFQDKISDYAIIATERSFFIFHARFMLYTYIYTENRKCNSRHAPQHKYRIFILLKKKSEFSFSH